MRKITIWFTCLLLFASMGVANAQTKVITGLVTGADDGMPIIGVTVMIPGTTVGTTTSLDGNYSLSVPLDTELLKFTFIGMITQEVIIGGRSVINIVMEQSKTALDEIIVTGVAGATERKKLSVTVTSVSAEEISKVPAGSAASALQGKVAGIQVTNLGRPGSGATILLRGAANFYGSQGPLVIMDGVYVAGGLADINVDDIESFQIVKGASASSLYGSRAGNGVIVITSKRGNIGKTLVTVRSEVGFSKINNLMATNMSHPYELAADWESYKGQYTKYEGVTYGANYQSVYADAGDNKVDGSRVLSADGYSDNPYGVYNDFQSALFRKGFNFTNYVSIASGNEKYRTFFSTENYKVNGVIKEADGYTRNSLRFNLDYYITDWLKFSASNAYIKIEDNNTLDDGDFRTVTRMAPDANILLDNPDGQPYYFQPDPWENEITNPLYLAYNIDAKTKQQRFLGGYKLNAKFTDYLNLDLEYSFENDNRRYTNNNKYESYTRTGDPIGFGYSKGSLTKTTSLNTVQKAQATLNFIRQFGELDVKAKVSYLAEDRHYEWFRARGNDYQYSGIPSLDNFAKEDVSISSNQTAERAQNVFLIGSIVYKDRYILDGLFRKDGSSLFGVNEKWNNYYRVSTAWRVTQDFVIPGVQELKINLARGTAGQRPSFTWQYEMTAIYGGVLDTDRIAGNPDLKPSLTTENEIGLNANFLNRFTLEFAYSEQESTDQFMLVKLFSPANAGKNRQWQNVGNLKTNTFEFSLGANLIKQKDLQWDMRINVTKTKSTIEELNVAQQHVGPDELFLLKEGTEYGSMYGYKFVRDLATMEAQLPDGTIITDYSVNSDGVVVETATIGTSDEKAYVEVGSDGVNLEQQIGRQTPDFLVGLTSNLSYKNFDLYMLFDWKNGGDIYNRNVQWNVIAGRSALVDQAGKAEADKKTVSYYASLYNVNENMDYWVEDGSYLKLRELALSYTLKGDKLKKFAKGIFTEVKLSAIARNIWTLTGYSGWDPEVAAWDNGTSQYYSVDYGVYPNQSSYSFSLQLKF